MLRNIESRAEQLVRQSPEVVSRALLDAKSRTLEFTKWVKQNKLSTISYALLFCSAADLAYLGTTMVAGNLDPITTTGHLMNDMGMICASTNLDGLERSSFNLGKKKILAGSQIALNIGSIVGVGLLNSGNPELAVAGFMMNATNAIASVLPTVGERYRNKIEINRF